MLLTATAGKIYDNGREILLRGGHCHLFSKVAGDRSVNQGRDPMVVTFSANGADRKGCPAERTETGLSLVNWDTYTAFLDELQATGCNLTRVFLSNGAELGPPLPGTSDPDVKTLHPFARLNGKWRVKAAIQDKVAAAWSSTYFNTLRDFTRAADLRGIAVQLCLFTFHDFKNDSSPTFQYWPFSFWNAKNADDETWADLNLVPRNPNWTPAKRNHFFMDVANSKLMDAQKAYVERVLATVCPRLRPNGNVILEIMNEPRIGEPNNHVHMATWLDRVTGWIQDWLADNSSTTVPLISANASYAHGVPATVDGESDVDFWAKPSSGLANYQFLDLVSYHGLTGVSDQSSSCGELTAQQTDLPTIQARINRHNAVHPAKALMFSTDAVRFGTQSFAQNSPQFDLERRDGQVRTTVDYAANLGQEEQRTRFDLDNWAYHAFTEGTKNGVLGHVHFQNHSTFEASFLVMRCAYQAATIPGPRLPCNGTPWPLRVTRVSGGANHQNFWWAHRHLPANNSELVNQFHTENGPGSAATAAGVSEIGWRFDLTAPGGLLKLAAPYDLRSASEIEDPQATVEQRLRLVISTIENNEPKTELAQAERVVQKGQQGKGRLELQVNLAAGVYAVTVTTRIAINYQNKTKVGYGETIVRFPSLLAG